MKKRWLILALIFLSSMTFAGCASGKTVQKSQTGKIKFQYNVPGHVFTAKKGVEFMLSGTSKGICRIYTYDRKKVFEKKMVLPGKVTIPELPNGYYFVEFTSSDEKVSKSDFAVVPDPSERKVSYDAPYSMDIALGGWKNIDEWVELTHLMGLKFVRERFHHARTEPVPGKYNWDVYGLAPEKLSEKGIHVSATWHNFAPWAKTDPKMTLAKDLKIPFEFAKKLASRYKGKINIWEFWNEPELMGFSKEGFWEYVSMLKAAYLGFKAGNPRVPVMNGAFCMPPWDNDYARAVMRNDLADYMDIFNFHSYRPLASYPKVVSEWKNILKDGGASDMMLCITETGTNAEGPAAIKPEKGTLYRHSPQQEMIWAEFIPKSQILWQFLGVSRTFFFSLRPLNERSGTKEWGILRRDKSVKPGYAAFSTLLNELGSAKCLGEVDLGKEMRGFLYQQPDGSRTLAFWSISELDTVKDNTPIPPFKDLKENCFEISGTSAAVVDSFGTPHTYTGKNGKIRIPSVRLTAYLHNAPAMKIIRPPAKQGVASPRKREMDRSIVFRIRPSRDYILNTSRCSMFINDQAKDKSLVLQVANFSDKTKNVVITAHGCELPGFPAKITLPPYSEKIAEIKTSAEKLAPGRYDLIFKGTSDGLPISQLEFPFRVIGGKMLDSVSIPGTDNPKKWRANSSGKMNITFDEPEQSLRFDAEFSKDVKDKWAYPFFDLPNGLKCSAISFDIKIDLEGEKALRYILMLNTAKKYRYFRFVPKNHQWVNIIFEFSGSGIDPKELQSFQIGMGVKSQSHITWYVRNIRIME